MGVETLHFADCVGTQNRKEIGHRLSVASGIDPGSVRCEDHFRMQTIAQCLLPVLATISIALPDDVNVRNSTSRTTFDFGVPERGNYLEPFTDKLFGSKVTRVVDDPGDGVHGTNILWSRPARHIYSSVAAWDCSDSLLAIRNAGATKVDGSGAWEWSLLDGRTFEPKSSLETSFVEFRWWNTRPRRMLLITSGDLIDYDPVTKKSVSIPGASAIFAKYRNPGLNGQGNLSNDDGTIVLSGADRKTGAVHAVAFSLEKGHIITGIPLKIPRLDYATVSPKGNYIVVVGEFEKGKGDRTQIYDLKGSQTGERWEPYGSPSHYDLAIDRDGREVAIGVAKSRLPNVDPGSIISRELETGKTTVLLRGGYGMHISCRNLKLPGWAFVSYPVTDSKTYPPFSDELVAVRIDGSGKFRRICRFHSRGGDYWAQPQASVNTAGTKAVFATNSGEPGRGAESFVVETFPDR